METRLVELTISSLLKAVQMSAKGLYFVVLFSVIGCQQAGVGQDTSSESGETVIVKAEPNAQLQLYKEALTDKGSSDRMRMNAANLLLFSKESAAR